MIEGINERITVSVCMITYNHGPYIQQAIESVIGQKTNFRIELVIGEDRSTDNTRQVCETAQQKYPDKIKLLSNSSNLGMMPNFLRTLQACTGEYIALCEGDDYWTDSLKLEKQVNFFKAHPTVVFNFHTTQVFDENSKTFYPYYKHVEFNTGIINKQLLFERGGGSFCTASTMFKTTILKFPRWFTEAATGDFPILLLAITAGDIGYMDEEMCVYRKAYGTSWSDSFTSFNKYQAYYYKEDSYIAEFNKETGYAYDPWIKPFNQLRDYRLILHYYHFNPSKISRLNFFLRNAGRLNLAYIFKSVFRIFFAF